MDFFLLLFLVHKIFTWTKKQNKKCLVKPNGNLPLYYKNEI